MRRKSKNPEDILERIKYERRRKEVQDIPEADIKYFCEVENWGLIRVAGNYRVDLGLMAQRFKRMGLNPYGKPIILKEKTEMINKIESQPTEVTDYAGDKLTVKRCVEKRNGEATLERGLTFKINDYHRNVFMTDEEFEYLIQHFMNKDGCKNPQ